MNEASAHLGRELARLISTLHGSSDLRMRDRASVVDHTFVRNCDREHVLDVLRPLPLLDGGNDRAAERAGMLGHIGSLNDEEYDTLCWEYRDERVVQLNASR